MVCEECLGELILAIISLLIGIYLSLKFYKERNNFTLYMALFFLLAGIGWLILVISKEWVLGIYELILPILIIIGIIPQLMLLFFILTFLEYSLTRRIGAVIISLLLIILHTFIPQYRIMTIVATIIIVANIILFILNWRRNNDIKSLGFSIGLLLILIGESLIFLSRLIQGIMLFLTAIIWAITYSGILEKITKK
ncbi:MAG: hypothetical protein EU549_01070 [Promethearchaeota archaeon]|nr:MAG: hypothetical protein EU549_01070 [Candidatus Lokiarchaeota archaeon]